MKRFFFLFICVVLTTTSLFAQEPLPTAAFERNDGWITIKSPGNSEIIIGKNPRLEGSFNQELLLDRIFIILDNVDVSQVAVITSKGFSYTPPLILSAGKHSLSILALDEQGNLLQKNLTFSIRHSKQFEESYSANEVTAIYEPLIAKSDSNNGSLANSTPDSKIEGNWSSNNSIKEDNWNVSLIGNLRYYDQSEPITSPLLKGIYPANYLLSGKYRNPNYSMAADLGDVVVNESAYTVQSLSRRGGTIGLNYQNFDFRTFSVLSQPVIGFENGLGIKEMTDDQINGISGGLKLMDNRMAFRAIYLSGGEPSRYLLTTGSPLGMATIPEPKKGNVSSYLLNTDFFGGLLKSEMELGHSSFDQNTQDQIDSKTDNAWRIKLGGAANRYLYEALYEKVGKDYEVVGNPIQKDREGLTLRGGADFNIQNVNLMFSRYNDNVTGDSLFPKIVTYQGSVDYNFIKFSSLPMGFAYQKVIQEAKEVPSGTLPTEFDIDTISGRINYLRAPWNLGFQTSFSKQNDRSSFNNDSSTKVYSIIPSYLTNTFSLIPSFSLNQIDYDLTGVRTDNYILNLQIIGKTYYEKITYGMGTTYNVIKSNNNTADGRTLSGNFQVIYALGKYLNGYLNPSVGVKGLYNHMVDRVNAGNGKDEFVLLLVLSSTTNLSF
jgi:hypothetical protein